MRTMVKGFLGLHQYPQWHNDLIALHGDGVWFGAESSFAFGERVPVIWEWKGLENGTVLLDKIK